MSQSPKDSCFSLLAKPCSLTCPQLQISCAETDFTGEPTSVSDCGCKARPAPTFPFWGSGHGCRRRVLTAPQTQGAFGDVTVYSNRGHAFSLEIWTCHHRRLVFRPAPSLTACTQQPARRRRRAAPEPAALMKYLATAQDRLPGLDAGTSQVENWMGSTMSM